ncbi:alternative ribosome rescue aminoacyl-tRNA hydrolase ArfB [Flavivirga eckloniae]|uniref:Aminoacyl-tRNA hydrolase n=1 Tax=Flavivirga eckloniae TaxID=1803846 RepID=A0A2K9PS27_9FLAO|nr:alternative ribosome rescue aminoacyl-tRNA hydrolase ArfB [Flavivirga eckloniae]AUP79861.1 aminoacyl-tRNA hydrolase [Flavivirga eckloniae]
MFNEDLLLQELTYKAIRSSGSGGQHVNKVSSKVELAFNLNESVVFNEEQKERLQSKLQHRLTKEGVLILQCDESRSQHKNKELVIKRFLELIRLGLVVQKKRIPTKTPKAVKRKRLKDKRSHSEKKTNRKKPDIE